MYVALINKTIDKTISEYAFPGYNLETICDTPSNQLYFTVDDTLLLDTILIKIRGKTIRFCGKEKKKQNVKEQELIRDIENLVSDKTLCNLSTLLEDKKTEQKEICNLKLKGNMIRSHAQWTDEMERL